MDTEDNERTIYVVSTGPSYDSGAPSEHFWSFDRSKALSALFGFFPSPNIDMRFFELRVPEWMTERLIDEYIAYASDTIVAPADPRHDTRMDLKDSFVEFALDVGLCRDGGEHEPSIRKARLEPDNDGTGFLLTAGCRKCKLESQVYVDPEMFEEWE